MIRTISKRSNCYLSLIWYNCWCNGLNLTKKSKRSEEGKWFVTAKWFALLSSSNITRHCSYSWFRDSSVNMSFVCVSLLQIVVLSSRYFSWVVTTILGCPFPVRQFFDCPQLSLSRFSSRRPPCIGWFSLETNWSPQFQYREPREKSRPGVAQIAMVVPSAVTQIRSCQIHDPKLYCMNYSVKSSNTRTGRR